MAAMALGHHAENKTKPALKTGGPKPGSETVQSGEASLRPVILLVPGLVIFTINAVERLHPAFRISGRSSAPWGSDSSLSTTKVKRFSSMRRNSGTVLIWEAITGRLTKAPSTVTSVVWPQRLLRDSIPR